MKLTWQVISTWVPVGGGSESVHVAAFETLEEARREAQRLSPQLGRPDGTRILRGVVIEGRFLETRKEAS